MMVNGKHHFYLNHRIAGHLNDEFHVTMNTPAGTQIFGNGNPAFFSMISPTKTWNKHLHISRGFPSHVWWRQAAGGQVAPVAGLVAVMEMHGPWDVIHDDYYEWSSIWVNLITTSLRPSPGIMVSKEHNPQIALIQVSEIL